MKKRLLAIFLALALVVSLMPVGVLAAHSEGNPSNDYTYNDKESARDETSVTANKTVTENQDGTYTVTLSVEGYTSETSETEYLPADIVLVVDTSTSMDDAVYVTCGNTVFREEHRSFLGVPYTVYVCTKCNTEYDLWEPSVCDHSTYIGDRLDVAKDAASQFVSGLLDSSNDIKIGLYDFSGSNRTNVGLTNNENSLLGAIEGLETPWLGDGTDYGFGLEGAQDILKSSSSDRSKFVVFLSDGEPQSGDTGIGTANQLKQAGVTIFTVGIDTGSTGNAANARKNISSKDEQNNAYFYTASSDGSSGSALTDILAQISETIQASVQAGTNAVMADVINTEYFDLVNNSLSDELTLGDDGKTLTWDIGEITSEKKEVSFVIEPKEGSFGKLYTNSDVSLTFNSDKTGTEVTFEKGAIGDPTVEIYKVTYTDGVEDAEVFPDQVYYLVSDVDSTSFEGEVPSRDGYTFNGWEKTENGYEVTNTAKWESTAPDLNGDAFKIRVQVDGKKVKDPYTYIEEPERFESGTYTGWKTTLDEYGDITCDFDYDTYNCADVKITLKNPDKYFIQVIMYGQYEGESGAKNVSVSEDGSEYTIDNMCDYLADHATIIILTKYNVEYYLDEQKLDGEYTDNSTYIINHSVVGTTDGVKDGKHDVSWHNPVCDNGTYKTGFRSMLELPEKAGFEVSGWTCNGGTEGAIYNNDNMSEPLRIRKILPADGNTIKFYATSTEIAKVNAGYFVLDPERFPDDFDPGTGYPTESYYPNATREKVTFNGDDEHEVDDTTGYIGYLTEDGEAYFNQHKDEEGRLVIDEGFDMDWLILPEDFGQMQDKYGKNTIVPYQINNHTLGDSWPNVTEKDTDGSYDSHQAYHVDCYIKNVKVDVIYDANYKNGGQYTHEDGATTGGSYTVLGNDGHDEDKGPNFTREGYTFTGWNTNPNGSGEDYDADKTITLMNSLVLYAQWEVDDEQTKDLTATVDYKLGDEVQEADHVDLKATVQVLAPDTLSTEGVEAKTYTGWKLDSITINDEEAESLPATVNNGDAVVCNYVKDESQTKELSYTVQYYKDNVLADTDTVTESVWVNDTEVPVDEEKINTTDKYEGYSFEKTVPDELPETIEANGVIKVYYTKDPVYTVSIAPADIVAYTGGKAYGAIVGEDGKESDVTASGLPRPGYHIELSADVVNWFTEHGVASTDPDEAAQDLSQYITFTYDDGNGTIREWTLTYRGIHDIDEITGEPTRYVYTLNATGNAPDVRLQYKDGDEYVFTDDFDMDENTVKAEYEMSIYPGDLNQNLIKAVIKVGEESIEATTKVGTGKLKVLSATDEQYTNPLINPETGKISAAVPAGEDVTFTVNDSQVELDDDQVSLLVDSVSDSAEFNAQLEEHAANAAGMEGAATESFYLDLVHAENGNVQVGLNGTLTINWPMPSDANPEGDFKIVHYIAMDRNDTFAVDDLTGDDYHTNEVIENDDGTLSFNVGGFSPFVLVYEAKETAVTVDKSASEWRPEVGDRVKYTLVVENTGNTTTDITVSDTLWKAGMTVYVDGNEMTLDQNGKLNIENVIAGAKITITYYYTPTWRDVGRLVNEATVTAGEVTDSDTVTVIVDDGWTPNIPDDDDEDVEPEVEYTPNWLNTDDHFAYIVGYEDGSVRPTANITRAEVATIFFRLLTDEARAEFWSSENDFTDVASDAWYNNAVSTLSGMGILGGYEDGSVRPNASITRAEFVAIATRFFDYSARYEGGFTDVSYGDWYADCVQASADMGLVNGYEDGSFRPNASITRAEACAIVNRVLHRIPHEDHLLSESVMNVWPDNPKSAWYYADMQEATNSHDYDWTRESGSVVEDWTDKLPERDWSALETEWANAYSK